MLLPGFCSRPPWVGETEYLGKAWLELIAYAGRKPFQSVTRPATGPVACHTTHTTISGSIKGSKVRAIMTVESECPASSAEIIMRITMV